LLFTSTKFSSIAVADKTNRAFKTPKQAQSITPDIREPAKTLLHWVDVNTMGLPVPIFCLKCQILNMFRNRKFGVMALSH